MVKIDLIYIGLLIGCIALIGSGIVMSSLVKYTKSVTGKFKEGVMNGYGDLVVKKASYVVDGVTYLWTAKPSDSLLLAPNPPPVVDVTEVQLFYNPADPADASCSSDISLRYFGYFIIVVAVLILLALIGIAIYVK